MEDQRKGHLCVDGKTETDRGQSRARVGRGVLYTYAALIVWLISVGYVVSVAQPALAAENVGNTSVVVEKVTGEMAGDVRRLSQGGNVHQDEVIETAPASASEIVFRDDTKVTLGPNTQMTLDSFVFDPDPGRGKFAINAAKGVFRFVTGNLAKDSYVIRTPSVTVGVRGTTFTSVTDDEGTTVLILECPRLFRWQPEKWSQWQEQYSGGITVETKSGKKLYLDQCGQTVTVNLDGTVTLGPAPDWAVALLEDLDDLVGEPSNNDDEPDGNGGGGNAGGGGGGGGTTIAGDPGDPGDPGGPGNQGGRNNNRSGQGDGTNPSGQFNSDGPGGNNNGGTNNPGGRGGRG